MRLQGFADGYFCPAFEVMKNRASSTAPRVFRNPAPWVSESYAYFCAVYSMMALTRFGVSFGFAWIINAAVPATMGAAMLVPVRLRYGL